MELWKAGQFASLDSKGQGEAVVGRWRAGRASAARTFSLKHLSTQTGSDKKGVVAVSEGVGERLTPFRSQGEEVGCGTASVLVCGVKGWCPDLTWLALALGTAIFGVIPT